MNDSKTDNGRSRHEQRELWTRDLAATPLHIGRIEEFLNRIPSDVRSILDVGCGSGVMTNALAHEYRVVGLDRSSEALRFVGAPVVRGNATDLPFEDSSFDMVLCTEVLEHVPDVQLAQVVQELKRVTRRYVLVSTPNSEDLDMRMIQCPQCRTRSNVYDHVQSFDVDSLSRLFAECTVEDCWFCGAPQPPDYPRWLLRLRQERLNVFWRADPSQFPMCPNCGNTDYRSRTVLSTILYVLTTAVYKVLTCARARKPDWIVMLFANDSAVVN